MIYLLYTFHGFFQTNYIQYITLKLLQVPGLKIGKGRWLIRREKVRIWFGPARHWRAYAGENGDVEPGRALYQRIGDGVMRDIAAVREQQLNMASRGAA
jgi:hypothetical protein